MIRSFGLLWLGVAALAFCYASNAQTPTQTDQTAAGTPDLGLDPVGPGDLVSIYIANLPESTRSYRVSGDGTITLPMMKAPLQVNGLLPAQIEKLLAKTLVDDHLLMKPIVSAGVLQYRSRTVTVVGSVNQPGTVQAIGQLHLLQVIAKAGGLSNDAGPEILVSTPVALPVPSSPAVHGSRAAPASPVLPTSPSGNQLRVDPSEAYTSDPASSGAFTSGNVRHIPVKELLQHSDPSLNVALQGGEEIRVPSVNKIYVVGNVHSPGTYPINEITGLTVMKALALCQGTLSFSQEKAYIYRPDPSGRLEIVVPLRDIMKRRASDVRLQANDVFYVPDASGRRLSATVLDRVAGFGSSTLSGMVVFGRF